MRLDRDRIETAHRAHLRERRLQLPPATAWSSRAACARPCQDGEAVDVLDRDHRILEAALVPGLRRALLALHRVSVDVVARKAVFGGDQVGRDALRHEIGRHRHRRIHRPGAAGGDDADTAHRIRRRRRSSVRAGPHMICAAAKFTASSPEAQKRLICTPGTAVPKPAFIAAKRAISPPASPTGSTTPRTTSSTLSFVEVVALLQRLQRRGGERQRGHLMQRAIDLAPAARGADVIVDIGFRHFASLRVRSGHWVIVQMRNCA